MVYRELIDGCRIMHGRNGREYRLPKLPNVSVDGFCAQTQTVYEFLGCFSYGNTCLPFCDVSTMFGETRAERYEHERGYCCLLHIRCQNQSVRLSRQFARQGPVLWHQFRLYIQPKDGPEPIETDDFRGNDVRIRTRLLHREICKRWVEELRLRDSRSDERWQKDGMQSQGNNTKLHRFATSKLWRN